MNESSVYPWARLSADTNGDGRFTITDLSAWLLDLLLLPGDTALYWLLTYLPGAAGFLEISENDYGGPIAIGLSIAIWLLALVCLGILLNAILDLDRRLTAFVAGRLREVRRQIRVLRRRVVAWSASILKSSRNRRMDGLRVEPLMLNAVERAVLRCLTNIDDGTVLTLDELAARLNRSAQEIRSAHARLKELALIEGGRDGRAKRDGLRITTAGQMVLIGH